MLYPYWFQKFVDTELILDCGMTLPGKGWPVSGSLIVKGTAEKSPLIMAWVGAKRPVWL